MRLPGVEVAVAVRRCGTVARRAVGRGAARARLGGVRSPPAPLSGGSEWIGFRSSFSTRRVNNSSIECAGYVIRFWTGVLEGDGPSVRCRGARLIGGSVPVTRTLNRALPKQSPFTRRHFHPPPDNGAISFGRSFSPSLAPFAEGNAPPPYFEGSRPLGRGQARL